MSMPGPKSPPPPQGSNAGGGGSGSYTQANRPLAIHTPLGADKLLLIGLNGQEAISQLYSFHLEALAEVRTTIPFEGLLGQKVTACLQLPASTYRYFNGIVIKVTEDGSDKLFTGYSL